MSDLFSKAGLKMKRKLGVIPKDIWNRLVDALYAFRIVSVVGGRLQRSANGTTLVIDGVRGGGGGGALNELVPSLDGATLTVSPGYVQEMMPEIGGTALNDPTPPTLTVSSAITLWRLVDWTVVKKGAAGSYEIDTLTRENARYVLSASENEVMPSVDVDTGVETDGLQVTRWADFVSDGGGGFVMSTGWRWGSHQVSFCEGAQEYLTRYERVQV